MAETFHAYVSVIPEEVLKDGRLPGNAKILYGILSALMRKKGYCWPSNQQLAEAMHCSEDAVRRWVTALRRYGYLRAEVQADRQFGGSVRRIYPASEEPAEEKPEGCSEIDPGYCEIHPGYSEKHPGYSEILQGVPGNSSGGSPKSVRGYPEECQGVPGKISGSLYIEGYKNNKKKKEKKECAPDAAQTLLAQCRALGQNGQGLEEAMQRFLTMRREVRKPVKSTQAAMLLWNRLQELSGGDSRQMTLLLDQATEHQWLSLYPLKEENRSQAIVEPETQDELVDLSGLRFV